MSMGKFGRKGENGRGKPLPKKQRLQVLQQTMQDAFAVGEEKAHDPAAVRVLVGDGMDGAVVEGEDGGVGEPQEDGRMGDQEELGPGLGAEVYLPEQGQLPLRGQGRLGLVQEVDAAGPEVVLDRG